MSQEKVLKTLESLGLAKPDAQVYIFLAKKGSQKGKDIAKALKMPKQHLYLILKNLQSKGIVNATLERPSRFSALPFEKALDLFVKAKMEEAQRIEGCKDEILSDWQSISLTEAVDQSPKFTVIEGRNSIYPRLKQMIEETKNQLSIISTVPGLMRADQFGLLDAAFSHSSETNTKFRFLTELSKENLRTMKLLLARMPKSEARFEGRTPELGLKLTLRMLIMDDAEAAFFVSQEADKEARETDDVCLWTNSSSIVNSFKAVFEDFWHNATDIENRISELETGKPTAKTCVINDPEAAKKKYDDAINTAEDEIIILTSSEGLAEAWMNFAPKKGLDVKIMAPITRGNLEVALKLSDRCQVRHVPGGYLGTTIVDGKILFQFKIPPLTGDKHYETLSFANSLYSNDSEYVKKARNMLDALWKLAITPSSVTVEEITEPKMYLSASVSDEEYSISRKDNALQKSMTSVEEKPKSITEEYVLTKIINAKRTPFKDPSKDVVQVYGSSASAVIHSPSSFNLPDMLLLFFHLNKQSSFGAEDWFQVHLWLETPKGRAFVPVAIAGDNPDGMERRKSSFSGTPASQNCYVLKKDELQIQVHGNTLFAGWTRPIPLFPPQYILPPASLLFESFGELKTSVITMIMP